MILSASRSTRHTLTRLMARSVLALLICIGAMPVANAHLMVAQQGTLNVVDDGAFMVMSLPTSAFSAVDDDGDGKLSREEFTTHEADLRAAVMRGIQLRDSEGARPLQGLMLTPVFKDESPREPTTQLIAMGRFALSSPYAPLALDMHLFGKTGAEKTQQITISRPADGRQQLLVLTPERPTHELFTSGWSTFTDYLLLGSEEHECQQKFPACRLKPRSLFLGWICSAQSPGVKNTCKPDDSHPDGSDGKSA